TPTGGRVESSPAVASPPPSPAVVPDPLVYVGSDDRKVYALDPATGAIVWATPLQGPVKASPAVVRGVVYVASNGDATGVPGAVYALDGATGAILWTHP